MGRKEDEEDHGKDSKDTNGSCIEELTKKCKPLNVQLSRLELPKNGIVLIKETTSENLKDFRLSSNIGEYSATIESNVENEENSNDTAETIKKIKEFIALGRCEETKKDQDTSDKKVGYKARVATKRKLLNKKDAKIPNKRLATNAERLNADRELERTLKGQDNVNSVSEVNDTIGNVISDKVGGRKHGSDVDEYTDSTLKNNELLITPSRVSKRIQSKSVKFSVKKMLRGDDINVLKRMIPGYQQNTPSKKEKTIEKKVKSEVKKQIAPVKLSPSPPREPKEPSQEKEVVKTPLPTVTTAPVEPVTNDSSEVTEVSPEIFPRCFAEPDNKEKLTTLSDKFGKFAIGNGKITVELTGSQQKKVVRIALPPSQTQSPLPNTSLGPDIIIKRVKPVKKTVVMPDDPSLGVKGIIEKELLIEHTPTNTSNILKERKLFPRVNLERITTPKLKENLAKMHKNILRHGRADKKQDKIDSKESKQHNIIDDSHAASQEIPLSDSIAESEPSTELATNVDADQTRISIVTPVIDKVGSIVNEETAQIVLTDSPEKEKSMSLIQDESKKLSQVEKTRGRKTAKVTPLTQVKSKGETITKKPLTKAKKPLVVPEKSHVSDESEILSPVKETYDNLFDRYFITRERYIEHHDSLDSDSSEDLNDDIYAHFINLRKRKELIGSNEERKEDTITMYDLMQDITLELPTWNIHVTSDGQAFCLAQVDVVDNIPVMKKVIEINLDYNAKVFVAGSVLPEFEGNYSGYEDIRQLIYDVDQL